MSILFYLLFHAIYVHSYEVVPVYGGSTLLNLNAIHMKCLNLSKNSISFESNCVHEDTSFYVTSNNPIKGLIKNSKGCISVYPNLSLSFQNDSCSEFLIYNNHIYHEFENFSYVLAATSDGSAYLSNKQNEGVLFKNLFVIPFPRLNVSEYRSENGITMSLRFDFLGSDVSGDLKLKVSGSTGNKKLFELSKQSVLDSSSFNIFENLLITFLDQNTGMESLAIIFSPNCFEKCPNTFCPTSCDINCIHPLYKSRKSGNCSSCSANNEYISNNECIECENNLIADKSLEACACRSGEILSTDKCISCQGPDMYILLINDEDQCVKCSNDQILDKKSNTCVSCKVNQVIDKENRECISCLNNEIFDTSSKKCVPCQNNQVADQKNNQCVSCQNNEVFDNTSTKCVPCQNNQVADQNQCVSCQNNEVFDNTSKKCVPCQNNQVADQNQCVSCPDDKNADSNSNTCVCKNNMILDSSQSCTCEDGWVKILVYMCKQCDEDQITLKNTCSSCLAGEEPDMAKKNCEPCKKGWVSDKNSKCSKCLNGRESNNNNTECIVPLTCDFGMISKGDACFPCPINTFPDANACTKCQQGTYSVGAGSPCEDIFFFGRKWMIIAYCIALLLLIIAPTILYFVVKASAETITDITDNSILIDGGDLSLIHEEVNIDVYNNEE